VKPLPGIIVRLLATWILLTGFKDAAAQLVVIDTTRPVIIPEVVVTATRTPRELERVPIPLTVIPASQIQAQAVTNVSELFAGQLGVNLEFSRFGAAGIQLQGLDAAYTLVMLDGEPLTTNVDGFADISRIPASSIERIEVTHGPSSSLYGSEALAGVVNIITKRSTRPFTTGAQVQYGTNNALDLNANAQMSGKKGSAAVFLNRFSSDGYDLISELPGATVPPYTTYNVTGRGDYRVANAATIRGTGFVSTQDVEGVSALQQGVADEAGNQWLKRRDWNLAPGLVYGNSTSGRLTVTTQAARSVVDANYEVDAQPELQDFLDFDQFRSETEVQYDRVVGSQFMASGGTGVTYESVSADFIAGTDRSTTSGYGYAQLEWFPNRQWDVIGSGRVDIHPDYATQFNPKLATSWKMSRKVRLQASVGRGFRAPTYEQRYINFTNPLGGSYTVLGSEGLIESLRLLDEAGFVREILVNPTSLPKIAPESSWAYSASVDYNPTSKLSMSGMLFFNDVNNLIETQVIAIAANGQNIFSYVNLGKVYTRGFKIDSDLSLPYSLTLGAGYQYLDAYSKDLDAQLGGRSRHSGTVRLQGDSKGIGGSAYVQAVFRSDYPYITGVNLTVDGSMLIDAVVTKKITSGISISGGVRNMLDFTAPVFQPQQPGRVFFIQTSFSN
jgi:outer membrane receptor for ferrienterochelin and colicins